MASADRRRTRQGWTLALGGLLLAGCGALLTPRVPLDVPPGLAASEEADTRACNRWSAGSGDEKIAFAGCMIARGYGASVDLHPAPIAWPAYVVVRRTTGAPDPQAITDLLNVCRARAVADDGRPSIADSALASVRGWFPGDPAVERAAARLQECLDPAGFAVSKGLRKAGRPHPDGDAGTSGAAGDCLLIARS